MARKVHAEGIRERQNMKRAAEQRDDRGRTDYVWVCRHCGAYHGHERHFGDCPNPECDATPDDQWSSTMTFPEDLDDDQRAAYDDDL